VLGVSRDTVATQARFREAESLPFSLVADEDGSLGKAFGVEQHTESAYRRQSFLVANGKVVWRDLAAQPGSQSADALTALAAQQGRRSGSVFRAPQFIVVDLSPGEPHYHRNLLVGGSYDDRRKTGRSTETTRHLDQRGR